MSNLLEIIDRWQRALGIVDVPLALIGIASLAVSVGALVLIVVFVISIPKNYFLGAEAPPWSLKTRHPWVNVGIHIAKNLLGAVLIVLGLLFLALPGQGIVTVLVGIVLLDFPGKRKLELRLIRRPKVLAALNWIRKRLGREPFAV